jgi:hypothetical protein
MEMKQAEDSLAKAKLEMEKVELLSRNSSPAHRHPS